MNARAPSSRPPTKELPAIRAERKRTSQRCNKRRRELAAGARLVDTLRGLQERCAPREVSWTGLAIRARGTATAGRPARGAARSGHHDRVRGGRRFGRPMLFEVVGRTDGSVWGDGRVRATRGSRRRRSTPGRCRPASAGWCGYGSTPATGSGSSATRNSVTSYDFRELPDLVPRGAGVTSGAEMPCMKSPRVGSVPVGDRGRPGRRHRALRCGRLARRTRRPRSRAFIRLQVELACTDPKSLDADRLRVKERAYLEQLLRRFREPGADGLSATHPREAGDCRRGSLALDVTGEDRVRFRPGFRGAGDRAGGRVGSPRGGGVDAEPDPPRDARSARTSPPSHWYRMMSDAALAQAGRTRPSPACSRRDN